MTNVLRTVLLAVAILSLTGADCGNPDGLSPCVDRDGNVVRVDLASSLDHCGACGNACRATLIGAVASCRGGACVESCAKGFARCAGGCFDLASDPAHCGACAKRCTIRGGTCAAGLCVGF